MFGNHSNLISFLISYLSKTFNICFSTKECSILSKVIWQNSKFKIFCYNLFLQLIKSFNANKTFDRKTIYWVGSSWCFWKWGKIKRWRFLRNWKYCFYQKFAKPCSQKRYFSFFWNKWYLGKKCYCSKRM